MLLLVLAGFEVDPAVLRGRVGTVLTIAVPSVAVPFAGGVAAAYLLPASVIGPAPRPLVGLFLGTALGISAIPVVARILMDLGALEGANGQVIVAVAVLVDTVGWIALSASSGLARTGGVDAAWLGRSLLLVAVVVAVAATAGRTAIRTVVDWTPPADTGGRIGVVAVAAFGAGAATHALGFEPVLGAFVVGAVAAGELDEEARRGLEAVTLGVFAPLFFGAAGLRVELSDLLSADAALAATGLLVVAVVGKVGGSYVGARVAGLDGPDALVVGVGLNARGALEFVVAAVGLSLGVLSPALYAAVVVIAVGTTVLTPPWLRWAARRAGEARERASTG